MQRTLPPSPAPTDVSNPRGSRSSPHPQPACAGSTHPCPPHAEPETSAAERWSRAGLPRSPAAPPPLTKQQRHAAAVYHTLSTPRAESALARPPLQQLCPLEVRRQRRRRAPRRQRRLLLRPRAAAAPARRRRTIPPPPRQQRAAAAPPPRARAAARPPTRRSRRGPRATRRARRGSASPHAWPRGAPPPRSRRTRRCCRSRSLRMSPRRCGRRACCTHGHGRPNAARARAMPVDLPALPLALLVRALLELAPLRSVPLVCGARLLSRAAAHGGRACTRRTTLVEVHERHVQHAALLAARATHARTRRQRHICSAPTRRTHSERQHQAAPHHHHHHHHHANTPRRGAHLQRTQSAGVHVLRVTQRAQVLRPAATRASQMQPVDVSAASETRAHHRRTQPHIIAHLDATISMWYAYIIACRRRERARARTCARIHACVRARAITHLEVRHEIAHHVHDHGRQRDDFPKPQHTHALRPPQVQCRVFNCPAPRVDPRRRAHTPRTPAPEGSLPFRLRAAHERAQRGQIIVAVARARHHCPPREPTDTPHLLFMGVPVTHSRGAFAL